MREKYSVMTNSILEGSYYEFQSIYLQQCLDTSSKQTQLVDLFVRTAEDPFEIFFPSNSKVPQRNLLIRMGHNLIHHGNFHGPHCNVNYCTCQQKGKMASYLPQLNPNPQLGKLLGLLSSFVFNNAGNIKLKKPPRIQLKSLIPWQKPNAHLLVKSIYYFIFHLYSLSGIDG